MTSALLRSLLDWHAFVDIYCVLGTNKAPKVREPVTAGVRSVKTHNETMAGAKEQINLGGKPGYPKGGQKLSWTWEFGGH